MVKWDEGGDSPVNDLLGMKVLHSIRNVAEYPDHLPVREELIVHKVIPQCSLCIILNPSALGKSVSSHRCDDTHWIGTNPHKFENVWLRFDIADISQGEIQTVMCTSSIRPRGET